MWKKIVILIVVLLAIGAFVVHRLYGQDNYDGSKYSAAVSSGISPGSKIELTLPDQFDTSHTLGQDTRTLIFAFSKTPGRTVANFLDEQAPGYLEERKAVFVANISPIPVIIRNSIALPMLRKNAYTVLLVYDENIAASLQGDHPADKIFVATMQGGVVQDLAIMSTATELATALQ